MTYVVESYDNYDAPSDRRHLKHGEFQHGAEALAAAQRVIDKDLLSAIAGGKSAAEALDQWRHFGEVPMIFGEPRIAFDPFEYAGRRAAELGNAERPKATAADLSAFADQAATAFVDGLNSAVALIDDERGRHSKFAVFFDVDGVPVTINDREVPFCCRWDCAPVAEFDQREVLSHGRRIDHWPEWEALRKRARDAWLAAQKDKEQPKG